MAIRRPNPPVNRREVLAEQARAIAREADALDSLGPVRGLSPEELLERFNGLCVHIARVVQVQLNLPGRALDDLLADAHEGLLEAQRRYDPEQGATFATYAHYRIKGGVFDGLRRRGELKPRLRAKVALDETLQATREAALDEPAPQEAGTPRHRREALARLERTMRQLVAGALLINTQRIEAEQSRLRSDARERLLLKETHQRLHTAMSHLTDIEREVLTAIYFEERALADLARERGYSRSWLCRVHARALERLQRLMVATR